MLEGEKALRGEVARQKAAVDRHLAQAQACADSAAAAALQAEQSELNVQLQKHSNQVHACRPCCMPVWPSGTSGMIPDLNTLLSVGPLAVAHGSSTTYNQISHSLVRLLQGTCKLKSA